MSKRPVLKGFFPEFTVFQLWLILLFLMSLRARGQSGYWPDSLSRQLDHTTDVREKVRLSATLANYYFGVDSAKSDTYALRSIETAEMSRDRLLMVRAYVANGERYLQSGGLTGNAQRAMDNFRRAEQIAGEDKLEAGLVYSYVPLARGFRNMGNPSQALAYSSQAVTAAGDGDDDSLQVLAYCSLGQTYQARNEKLLAFRNYLKALD